VSALVTGCAGFIGSHLAERLLRDQEPVIGIDCFNDNYGRAQKLRNLRHLTDWDSFDFVPIDLARGSLEDVVASSDVIYHLAAEPGVRTSWGTRYEQYLRNNVLATQHLLEALRNTDSSSRMVYASSSSVYGSAPSRPTVEGSVLAPRSPYGQTKAAMEHLCELYRANFGTDVVGLRYFTVYGPRQRPDMAFYRLCRCAVDNSPFVVFGDGTQTRDFSYVDDVVTVTRAAATAQLPDVRIFNIGGGTPASLRQVIELVENLAGARLQVTFSESEYGDVRDTAADTSLARRWLGFQPQASLESGLEREFDWVATQTTQESQA
jgi:UDP-glucuronate 4-epimerase